VATTLAYPLLDLLLLGSTLLAAAARGWHFDRVLAGLAVGFGFMALADSIYAVQIANDTYRDATLVESLWPAGAVCIAAAAWFKDTVNSWESPEERELPALAAAAIVLGITVLLVDHFAGLDTMTVLLAAATLLIGVLQRVGILRKGARAESATVAAEALHSASAEAALDCIVSMDAEGKVREWNDAARETFGYRKEEVLGRDLADLIIPPEQREQHRRGLRHTVETGEGRILDRRLEVMATHRRGSHFPVELIITRVRVDPPLFTGFLRDISERKQREEENARLAAIVRSSEDAIISTDRTGIVTAWNPAAHRLYGYSAQDALGRRLDALIVPPERTDELAMITGKVFDGKPLALDTERRSKSGEIVHVALRAFPIRDLSGEIVGASTNAHDISERHRREERERLDEEGRLWRGRVENALAKGHFVFWGQPVVDATSGAVHHHELLLRMDLDGNIVTPNHFLPHAEGSDLITEIDRWAVRTGIGFAATLPVAINLSGRSLRNPELITEIKKELGGTARAKLVTFEITETAAVEDLDAAHDFVEELTSIGCGVALDDFGTGYGSFNYLKRLPVSELKIDIDFVRGVLSDPNDRRLVKSIVDVARNFGMKTVAEGVEDEATLVLLRELGVDFVQGYHVGYPAQMSVAGRWPSAIGPFGALPPRPVSGS
jgi:PAS domain S-box-containing protein